MRNWKVFHGSFYRLYLCTTVMNVFGYLNIYVIFRLPQNTCKDCVLAPIFEQKHFWGLEILNYLYVHMNTLRHMMSLIVSFNRFTMVFLPFSFEKLWIDWWIYILVIGFLVPFSVNHPVLLGVSTYQYVKDLDVFQTRSTNYVTQMFTNIIILNSAITLINLVLTIATCVRLYTVQMRNRSVIRRTELNLFMMSVATFAVHMLDIIRVTINNILGDHINRSTTMSVILMVVEPYFADAMTLLSPLFLIICSSAVRQQAFQRKQTVSILTNSVNQKTVYN
ncbi:unnamed protein product [Auanema sp. JU1783]|nr:unnamed protein product [Auanema sp. JU1783]